jgi:transcriptional regulator with GAF, ATPase, and Fis domain
LRQKPAPVRLVNDPENDPITRDMVEALGKPDSSFLILAVRIEGRRMGAVVMRADGRGRYDEEHARLAAPLNEPFGLAMANFLEHLEVSRLKEALAEDVRFLRRELRSGAGEEIVGADFGLRPVLDMVGKVAPLASPVLILGETGAGKELIANAVHYSSPRSGGPLVKVNCGAMPENLVESELFGHEKGAFTGAVRDRKGRFERAEGGSIFLDEIGELRPEVQVRLLRVLQSGDFERVGGQNPIRADVRVLAATHRDLERMVEQGTFRRDLYYRLNVFPIPVPPLRERKNDLPALVRHFIDKKAREIGLPDIPKLAPGEMDRLLAYAWPGNVRELANAIERALILGGGNPVVFRDLSPDGNHSGASVLPSSRTPTKFLTLDQAMADHIRRGLETANGKIEGPDGAAGLLGLKPSTLRNRMKKLKILR